MSARASAPEPARDYSNRSWPFLALLGVALAGGILLVAADLSVLFRVQVGEVTKQTVSGHGQHGWAVFLLGLTALVLAWAAGRMRSRPAMAALSLVGLAVLLIGLTQDLPDINSTGVLYERTYEQAIATAGPAFYLETAGAVVLIAAGVFGLMMRLGLPAPAPAAPAGRRAVS